jgi:hypothetical protein
MTQITFEGTTYNLTGEADFTNKCFPSMNYSQVDDGEEYQFEMSCPCTDSEGNDYVMYWVFEDVKGSEKELDMFDYENGVSRVEEAY